MADQTIKEESLNEASSKADGDNELEAENIDEAEEDDRSSVASQAISSASKKLANLQRATRVPRELRASVDEGNALQALDSLQDLFKHESPALKEL